jgi:tetratricopeptide (TPR) repeat protein
MIKKSFLRRGIEYILLLLLAIFVASCGVRNKNSQVYSTPKEKEVTLLRKITTIYIDKPKKALQMLDSAEQHRLIPIEEIQNLRAMSYFYGLDNPQKALECANKGYSNAIENVDTLAQLNSLKVLVTVYYMQSHYTEVIIKSNEAIELALKIKDKESVAFFYMALGSAKSEIDNLNDALDYLNKSIEIYQTIVEDSARWATCNNMLYALTKQVDVYASNRFYDKAVSLIPRCQALLDYLKKSDSATIGLNDIREAELMAACSKAYYGAGETKKAEKCYEKLRLTKYGNTDHGIALAVPYLVNSGQYAEALRCIKIKKKHMQECHSIVTYYYNKVLLRNEFKCYYNLNMYKEASFSANENMVMADSLRAREKKDYVRTVKKVFADRDIQLQLIKHEQKAETSQIVILLATILVVALGLQQSLQTIQSIGFSCGKG